MLENFKPISRIKSSKLYNDLYKKTVILNEKRKQIKHFNYKVATIIFVLLVTVLDSHSWLARIAPTRELNKMKVVKENYIKQIAENKKKYNELKTDNENLEKFAREQYFMKKKNEEVFVIVEEQPDKK